MSKRWTALGILTVALFARVMLGDGARTRERPAVQAPGGASQAASSQLVVPRRTLSTMRAGTSDARAEPTIWLRIVDGHERPIALASASLFKRTAQELGAQEDFSASASDAHGLVELSMPDVELTPGERLFVRIEAEGHPLRLLSEEELALALAPAEPQRVRLAEFARVRVYACKTRHEPVRVGYFGEGDEADAASVELDCAGLRDTYDVALAPGVYHFAAVRPSTQQGSYATQRVALLGGQRLGLDLRTTHAPLMVRSVAVLGAEERPIAGVTVRVTSAGGARAGLAAWLNGSEQTSDAEGRFTLLSGAGEPVSVSLRPPGMREPELAEVAAAARTIRLAHYRPVVCRFVERDGQRASYQSAELRSLDPARGFAFSHTASAAGDEDFVFVWPASSAPLVVSSWGFTPVVLRAFADPCLLVREN